MVSIKIDAPCHIYEILNTMFKHYVNLFRNEICTVVNCRHQTALFVIDFNSYTNCFHYFIVYFFTYSNCFLITLLHVCKSKLIL